MRKCEGIDKIKEPIMKFSSTRMARLSGLLREGKEEVDESDSKEEKDMKETDEVDETYEVDEADMKELEESIQVRKVIRAELEQMWASGQVFGKKSGKPKGVTMGFAGIGFKK